MQALQEQIERKVFGVCSYLSEAMGIRISTVRLNFIYLSFVTFGSPVVVYFFLAFWLNIKKHLSQGVKAIID